MAKRKRVQCFGHGAVNAGPQYQTHWEDVWLRWEQPRRVIQRAALCLMTRAELDADLFIHEECLRKHGDGHADSVAHDRRMLALLDAQPFARDDYDCPNVYTNAAYIDRAESERMLAWFLADAHGVKSPKFVWRRRKDNCFIGACSFAGIRERHESATSDPARVGSSDEGKAVGSATAKDSGVLPDGV